MKRKVMMAALLPIGLVTMLPSLASADAVPLKVGALEISPTLDVKTAYNDNIHMQETQPVSSWLTTLDPALAIVSQKGGSTFEANYRLSSGFYSASASDNYVDHFGGLTAALGLGSSSNINLWANYNKTHDDRGATFIGLPVTFAEPHKYHESIVGGKFDFGTRARLEAEGEYSNKRYDNNLTVMQSRDIDTTGGKVAFLAPLGPKTFAVVETSYTRFDYKLFSATANLDSNEQSYMVGLDWEATAKTSGSLRLGYLKKNFSQSTFNDPSMFSWNLSATWEPMTYSSWMLTASSKPIESSGTGFYTRSTSANVLWNHDWSSDLSHMASVTYTDDKVEGANLNRKDKTSNVSLKLNYQVLGWLSVNAAYDYTNRSSDGLNSSFKQNIWSVGVQGTL